MTAETGRGADRILPIAIALLCFAVISPSLWSGWLGDDAFYSALDGVLGADRISLAQAMQHSFDLWFFGNGRLYPGLVVEKYLVFAVFTNLVAYKALLVLTTIGTVELFRRCVAAYATPWVANVSALIGVTLFAERGYHDPILAYNAMPQLVALATLGSILAFRRVADGRDGAVKILAVALFALAALTYEDAYGFGILYVGLARSRGASWRRALRLAAPYLAIGIGLAFASLVLRSAAHVPPGSLYASNLAWADVLRTFLDQSVAAFPLAYWLFDPSRIYSRANLFDFYNNAPVNLALFAAFVLVTARAFAESGRDGTPPRNLITIGAAVVVLAAAPIAIIVKYQSELRLGLGYLPVFFEVFGVALVLTGLAMSTLRLKCAGLAKVAWILAIASFGAMTQATNVRLVRENQASKVARIALEDQLDGGLLANVPDGTTLAMRRSFDWIAYDDEGPDGISTRGLFFLHGGKRIYVSAPGDTRAALGLSYDSSTRTWKIRSLQQTSRCSSIAPRSCAR